MKNDSVVQTWCKRTTLATLVLWYDSQGGKFRSLSELVRTVLEGMQEIIRENGEVVIESTEEANEILEAFKLESLNPGGKGRRNLYSNLIGASLTSTSKEVERAHEIRRESVSRKEGQLSEIDNIVKQQVEKFDREERELKERISDASEEINLQEYEKKEKEQLKEIKNALGMVPPNMAT